MKTQQTVTTGYLLPRAATLAVLMVVVGCDSGRETDSIATPPAAPAPEERAAGDARPDYTDRVTSSEMDPDEMDQGAARTSGEAPGDSQDAEPKSALAQVRPTIHGKAEGTVTFALGEGGEGDQEMWVTVDLEGLEPGPHGIHIHEVGDCSADDASSAGGHFNPQDTSHGSPDAAERHAGDMGNIEADGDGRVDTELTFRGLALSGPTSILDRAVVIHLKKDDLESQPAGDAGDRVGCGVIRGESKSSAQ
ncbi:superoxide dismutase family protein [Haliea sp. E1-2-M8]|uniref:superoxide dismutase family protein n=1 Tax=Haliea sp. E1-2-M8 TaxID=3064706 RepID=UPI00271C2FF2|nr:superoxide dismutase family protein [Haliea sp. E1-2-M8]MDO8862986.1 superoxide dismutase family protein [Haliea sp. E1-2-M8]